MLLDTDFASSIHLCFGCIFLGNPFLSFLDFFLIFYGKAQPQKFGTFGDTGHAPTSISVSISWVLMD